jgi:hypothetical protein
VVQPGSSWCHGRKVYNISRFGVLHRPRADAGCGQGIAALSEHTLGSIQVLNAAWAPLRKMRLGTTAGVLVSILNQLCSALPVLFVWC